MGLLKASIPLLTLACLIYVSNGSAIKDPNYQASDSSPNSSRTFGVKTVTRQTIHSNDGVVTRVFKHTKVQTGTSLPQGSENQNFPTSGLDDTVHGLLPADDAKPLHFGARLGSNTKRFECNVKGGCSTQVSTSGGNVFGGSDHSNQGSHQGGQSVQGTVHQDDGQNIHSNFEQKAVDNVQKPFPYEEQQQHQEPFVDQNSQQDQGSFSHQDQNQGPIVNQGQQEQSSFQDQQQHQDSFSEQDQQQQGLFSNQGQDQHQSFNYDQGQQQVEDVLGNDFDSQYEDAFKNVAQVDGVVREPHIPVIDAEFPEQGQRQTDFDAGNVVPFQQVSDFSQQQQVNQGQTRVSSGINENFGFFEQQRRNNVQDGADEFIPAVVDQQNVADVFNQERFHQQDGVAQNFEGPNRDFGFNQGSTFRQQFVPQSQVANENTYNYQEEGEQFYQDPIEALRYSVPGSPGEDYPILYKVPETPFQCDQQQFPAGIYGDVDAQCQVFHFCKESGGQDSFLCPNGTVFNQQYFVCDWWYNYNCSDTPSFYNLNAQLYWDFDNFEPTQIQTGSGITSAENQFDNSGEFHSQVTTNSYTGSRPDYVQQQSQFSQSNNQQVHSTSSYQQTSNSGPSRQQVNFESSHQQVSNFGSSHQEVSGFRSPGQQYNLNSFVEKPQDIGVVQENVVSSFPQQRDSVQQAFDNVDGQNIDTHSEQQISDSHFNNKPAPNVPVTVTQADAFSQTQTGSFDFQSERRSEGPDGASFGQSLANVNSEDFSDKQQHNNLGSSDSSDTKREWKPDSNSRSHYPEQNEHVQGQADYQHQLQSNQELLKETVGKVTPDQGNSESSSSSLGGSIITQTNAFTEDADRLDKQNQNIPQTKIQQKAVEFPLESSGRSEESGKLDSASDSHTETFPVEGFSTETPQDVVQQQNQFDSFQDNVSFRRQALLPSLTQNNIADNKGVQVFVENFQQAINQPNSFEEVIVPEVYPEVDDDSQSSRDDDDSGIVKQNEVKNVFDGQQVIDVPDAAQDAIDYDEVLNQFRDRNVAFVDAGNIPQTLKDNQRVIENRPAQVHRLSIQQDRNKNENDNLQFQKPNVVQQQNIQVHDIFTIMRGSPNFKQEAGQALNEQRLSFRPYGQNAAPGLNYNLQEGKQIQNSVSNLAVKNEAIHPNLKQEVREQVIFPVEQPQGNKQNPWWNNAQNKENFRPTNQQGQQIKSGVQHPDAGISHTVSVKEGPSNYNLNVPTNGHQAQLPNFENFNQPQGDDRSFNENNQNVFQQNQLQNVKGQPQIFSENNQQQFQNSQAQFQNENHQQQFQNNQQQFLNSQAQFYNENNQQHFQNNQQLFQNNQQQFQVNQPQQLRVNQQQQFQGNQQQQFQSNQQQQFQSNQQQQFQGNQLQFHNLNDQINLNNVNNEQQFNNGPLLQNNQPQFHSANNQQPFQHINNQPQLNNVDNQQQLHNVNFEQNSGVKGIQNHSQRQNTDGTNFEENHGVKEFHGQQTFREARNDFNFPRQNPQTINANDAVVYSQNVARAAESNISYNGWKPIVKH